jgi:uncharacterized oligopeptide transporter (OPT) family protein
MLLGGLLALSNLYAGLKTGWSFSVAITACILSWSLWRGLAGLGATRRPPGILEDNCMQTTASAAGYSIVSLMVAAVPAYHMVTGVRLQPLWLMLWTFFVSTLGIMLFLPFKRNLVNHEELVFPSGVAAAETLRGLHRSGQGALRHARGLFTGMGLGAVGYWLSWNNAFSWWRVPRVPESLFLPGTWRSLPLDRLTVGVDLAGVSLAGGALIGMRVAAWMLVGSTVGYLVLAPPLFLGGHLGSGLDYGAIQNGFALWLGAAVMVGASLTDLWFQRRTVGRAFLGVLRLARRDVGAGPDPLAEVEVPGRWFVVGTALCVIGLLATGRLAFALGPGTILTGVVLSLLFVLVACRAVGETDIIPVGQLGKLAQLGFGGLSPGRVGANLMATSITTSSAACAADLATNLKCGWILGAHPRKQFLAQFLGVAAGTLVVVPAFYVLVPDAGVLGSTHLPAPAAVAWRAIAELMGHGFAALAPTARLGLTAGLAAGVALAALAEAAPRRWWVPSPFGLGLGLVIPFSQSAAFVAGAGLALAARRLFPRRAAEDTVPVASGIIAGESLLGVVLGTLAALGVMGGGG